MTTRQENKALNALAEDCDEITAADRLFVLGQYASAVAVKDQAESLPGWRFRRRAALRVQAADMLHSARMLLEDVTGLSGTQTRDAHRYLSGQTS